MNKVDFFFPKVVQQALHSMLMTTVKNTNKSYSQKPAISWDDLRIRSVFALLVKKLRKIDRLKIEKFCKSI